MVKVIGNKGGAVNVQVHGIAEVVQFLAKKDILIRTLAEKGLIRAGNLVQGEVQESILGNRGLSKAVQTGRLANSIKVRPVGPGLKGVKIIAEKESYPNSNITTEDTAKFVEYGSSGMLPRPNFRNTIARTEKEVRDIVGFQLKMI